jgi:hypothetical protein
MTNAAMHRSKASDAHTTHTRESHESTSADDW